MILNGKRALVTGGTRGIGKSIVFELAATGATVVFTYFSSDEIARKLEEEAAAMGYKIFGFKADAASF
ncbi:MAG TPA: SDR family NAD(P)-dependent oxidoreductase, partial [Ignavibacteriaceae bacterium]|nr:SDR family NAD(P)-dependent oxidoreductase [Ignavibacteriaceae bacterium]